VVRVELSDEADAHVTPIDACWRENRLAAPELFTDQLGRALADLGTTPTLGPVYRAGSPAVRRLLLRRTHSARPFSRSPLRWSTAAPPLSPRPYRAEKRAKAASAGQPIVVER
jgi:hypothetical protein